jgi:hypothetical protein
MASPAVREDDVPDKIPAPYHEADSECDRDHGAGAAGLQLFELSLPEFIGMDRS